MKGLMGHQNGPGQTMKLPEMRGGRRGQREVRPPLRNPDDPEHSLAEGHSMLQTGTQ